MGVHCGSITGSLRKKRARVCWGNLQVPGLLYLPGPETGGLPALPQEVQPVSEAAAAAAVMQCNNPVSSLFFHRRLVWIGHQTGQKLSKIDSRTAEKITGANLPTVQGLLITAYPSQPVPTSSL